jgi:hypothetical protein
MAEEKWDIDFVVLKDEDALKKAKEMALNENWEPFAVTGENQYHFREIWFKKRIY